MGFLSGILGGSQKTTVPASGFYSQPAEYQSAYNSILGNLNQSLPQISAGMFQPLAQTPDETAALDLFRQGFAPTAETLSSDIGMFMNPYQQYVEDPVNRAAQSDFSILKQNQTQGGTFGSNRQMLGANDIENTRLNQIGLLRKGAYDTALNTVMNQLIPQRVADAQGLLGVGDFQRELDARSRLAPLSAIQSQIGLLGGIPTQFGEFGSPQTTVKTGGGLSGLLSGASSLASIAGAFSDIRLKENIRLIGEENGFNIYQFNYVGEDQIYEGVMAHEVEKVKPEAVGEVGGYKTVNYDMIGVEMRAV